MNKVFHGLGVRVLVGHSRKSLFKSVTNLDAPERDVHTLAVSEHLAHSAEIIRVHNLGIHQEFQRTKWRLDAS